MTETVTKNPVPKVYTGSPVGDVQKRTWTMTPACPSGPCDLDVVSVHVGAAAFTGIKLHFAQTNGTFTNTYSYLEGCGSKVKDGFKLTVVSTFTVTSVSADGSTATGIGGTQLLSAKASPAALKAGCRDFGGIEYDLKGVPAKG